MTTAMDVLSAGKDAQALDVNNSGIACGFARDAGNAQRAVIWDTSDGSLTQLTELSGTGFSVAYAIADDGTIVGECSRTSPGGTRATKWTDPSTPVHLVALDPADLVDEAQGFDISNGTGDVVGRSTNGNTPISTKHTAVLWSPTISDIGGSDSSSARGVNSADDMVGFDGNDPVIWPGAGAVSILSLPGGSSSGRAEDVNDLQDIVGWDDSGNAMVWYGGGGTPDVLAGLTGATSVQAYGNNVNDDVVGASNTTADGNFHGVYWSGGGDPQELDSLPGATDAAAFAITDAGDVIVGYSDDGTSYFAVVFSIVTPDNAALSDGYWG